MNILITGGNGYIGKFLYENLKEEFNVTKISREDFDLTNIKSTLLFFENKYFDVVINCASKGRVLEKNDIKKDDWDVMKNNLTIFYNLVGCSDHFSKFINLGSGSELYDNLSPYGLSKYVIRQSLLSIPNFYNVRIFGVFDENEIDRRFIKTNIKKYINKEPLIIFKNKKMDFFYIKDFLLVIKYYILGNDILKEFDCTYFETKSLVDIANIINTLDDYQVDIIINGEDKNDYCGKYNSINLNYIGLKQGIKNVYTLLKI